MSVHLSGFRSMNIVYVPGATVLPLITSGTSVLSWVELLAPARHTGWSGLATLPYLSPVPANTSRPRLIGRPYVISIHLPPRYVGSAAFGSYLPPISVAAVPAGLAGRRPCATITT